MLNVVVCVSGGGSNLQALLDSCAKEGLSNVTISGVISNNQNAYALERAQKAGIKSVCIAPKDFENRQLFNEEFLERIKEMKPDLIVLAGFLVAIPESMVQEFKHRIINIHPSLIPSFCGTGFYGLKVHQAVLERGAKITGATVHFVDEGMDTGKIIYQKAVEVKEDDTPEILQQRVMEEAEWILLPKAVKEIAAGRISIG